jgi:adenylate cyclase
MPTIEYADGRRIRVPRGTTVLSASLGEQLDHAHACGGRGRCTTCRVLVEAGDAHCPPPTAAEAEALALNGLEAPIRLACQLAPVGDVRVRVLIESHIAPCQSVPDAVEESVGVVFADLRGFTAFAEGRLPFDVCNVLNRYFDSMGVHVERNGGHILDYLGDGIMILFRPVDTEDPLRAAARCSLDMQRASETFRRYVWKHFRGELRVGVAAHAGRAVVGALGYFRNRQLNAVGDALNVVARLESLNSELGTAVLFSAEVLDACRDFVEVGRQFELPVRGRAGAVTAYEVLGECGAA